MSAALTAPGPQPSLENNLQCQLCHRPFAPDGEARAVWRTDPYQPLPMACPHCRATNIYRFQNLVISPRGQLPRPARSSERPPVPSVAR